MTINSTPILDAIIKKINDNSLQLASLPSAIIKVNQILANEYVNLHDIAKVIQGEISLTARILRIANSPAIRGSTEVGSISDAIARLGITLVKNLAIAVSLTDKFKTHNVTHSALLTVLAEDSIQRSIYGFMVAKYLTPKLNPELALINGLVSKIGHIITLRYLNNIDPLISLNDTIEILDKIGDQVTRSLIEKWDLPKTCANTILHCEDNEIYNLESYCDVFITVNQYLAYKDNHVTKHSDMWQRIDEIIEDHHEEYVGLVVILA